jgi:hypothetical protein
VKYNNNIKQEEKKSNRNNNNNNKKEDTTTENVSYQSIFCFLMNIFTDLFIDKF